MNKRKFLAILAFTVFTLSQATQIALVFGINEGVTLNIEGSAPVISAVSLTDTSDNVVTTIDPEATYKFKFTVSHTNTLDYLSNIVVDIYYGSLTTDDIRSCYTFTWTEGAGSTPFISSPSGYVVSSVTPTPEQELLGSFNFELQFKLDGVAIPSGSSTSWHIDVTATDDTPVNSSNTDTLFDVTKYNSFSVSTFNILFGNAEPGETLAKQNVTVTLTANTQVDINVQGADLTSGTNSIPISQFKAYDNDGANTAYTLSTTNTTVYNDYKAITDTINSGVTGYTDNGNRVVGFDGIVPLVQAVGTYTATWKILLDQNDVTPN